MKRFAFLVLLVLAPLALFAQGQQAPERRMLQQLGLTDAQVSQVIDIQSKTRDALVQDAAQARLLRAQISKAMVAGAVDMQAVNGLVDQLSQARAAAQKTMLAAGVQLQQIMGPDNFRVYMRHLRQQFARGMGKWPGPRNHPGGPRGMPGMGGGGAWM
jgi:Spy/CpxP family protein refolding chaperone